MSYTKARSERAATPLQRSLYIVYLQIAVQSLFSHQIFDAAAGARYLLVFQNIARSTASVLAGADPDHHKDCASVFLQHVPICLGKTQLDFLAH